MIKTGDSRYIYQKKLDKACFQHDMAHGDFKDLPRRILFQWSCFNGYKFFDKKASARLANRFTDGAITRHGQRPHLFKIILILKIKLFQTSN